MSSGSRDHDKLREELDDKLVSELTLICKRLDISGYSDVTKKELIEKIVTAAQDHPGEVYKEVGLRAPGPLGNALTLLDWLRSHQPAVTVTSILVTVVATLVTLRYSSNLFGPQFESIEKINIEESTVSAVDSVGREWNRSFESEISHHLLADLNGDEKKEVLLGFSEEGPQGSQVMALTSQGQTLWSYQQDRSTPYPGPTPTGQVVSDLVTISSINSVFVAALFKESTWYQSAVVLLRSDGDKLGTLWHPGHLHEAIYYRGKLIVRGVNNDLARFLKSENNGNPGVIFGIKTDSIYGQSPPYLGNNRMNQSFSFYYAISDPETKFSNLEVDLTRERIRAKINCGLFLYLSSDGVIENRIGVSDNENCPSELRIISGLQVSPYASRSDSANAGFYSR
ncbi:Rho termination factor N-terminal domain-containing protein [Salinibacter ruber]|uniref:Rho termination factor N-terminal domain-containing protein n=1 Tax=Salinibacter ruber TaxID=146919 RepID=UPI0021689DB9|nr:Rho termination factor N-terminal domain-containing protein [Salinibacter ruber]MCS4103211.1 hypothetical protein [Salinibacter ruber]